VTAAFAAARETGTCTFSFRIVGKQGQVRWLEVRERVTQDANGQRVLGAAQSERGARVLVIDDQEPVLELAREFLGRAGHHVETALGGQAGLARFEAAPFAFDAVILGNGRLALAELPASHPVRPRLERMRVAAEHGAGLTEQMLAYAGRAPQALKPLNLSALVAEMLDLARASLSVRVVLRETLAADVWVQGDETQLRQVVLNLVANAGESFGEQAGAVELATRSVRATSSATLTFTPVDPPVKRPSSRVRRRAIWKASASLTNAHSSITSKWREVGILSPPIPSTL